MVPTGKTASTAKNESSRRQVKARPTLPSSRGPRGDGPAEYSASSESPPPSMHLEERVELAGSFSTASPRGHMDSRRIEDAQFVRPGVRHDDPAIGHDERVPGPVEQVWTLSLQGADRDLRFRADVPIEPGSGWWSGVLDDSYVGAVALPRPPVRGSGRRGVAGRRRRCTRRSRGRVWSGRATASFESPVVFRREFRPWKLWPATRKREQPERF